MARHVFSIIETPAGPRLAVDGVAQNAVAAMPDPFVSPADIPASGCAEAMRSMADAGVRLFSNVWSVRNRPHDWWLGVGQYDWNAFDDMAQCLLDACPDGWIMPRIKLEPPPWWVDGHPGEMSSSGVEVKAASRPWRDLYRRMLRDVLAHAETAAYADRVVGWHIGAFHCGEWLDCERPRSEIPAVDGRWADDPLAPPEATAARREYGRARAREVADALLDAAKLVKELTRGEKIVCAFFGYGWPDHEDMMRVIRSGLVDVFSSPAYYGAAIRGPGAAGVQQACYTASFALHGRLFMEEADPRTHLAKMPPEKAAVSAALHGAGWAEDLAQSVGVIRRTIGKNLAQGTGLWWFLIAGNGTFDAPEIMESVKVGVEEMGRTLRARGRASLPKTADVAVFTKADEYATSLVCHSLSLYEYRYRLHTSLLPRCGVAYDSYELSDIVDPRVGDYSVYVLPNAFSPTDAEKAAIARLEAAGKRIVRIPEPIDVDELRARLASVGAHVYLDTGDVVFAGRGYLTVHASKAGAKRIRLPYPCDIKDIFGAAPERKGVTEFVEEMAFGETRVYALRPSCRECDKLAVAIVLPEKATVSEEFAANELKHHLEKATGDAVAIVVEGENGGRGATALPDRRFYVGNTKALSGAGIDYGALGVEERIVKGVGGDLYLAGGELPRFDEIVNTGKFRQSYALAGGGTLYAIYDFLENEMGVRWIWPGELGEVVPRRAIPDMDGVERRGREPLLRRSLRGNLEGMRRIAVANRLWGWKSAENARREVERRELWMTRNRMGFRRAFRFGHAFTGWHGRFPDHPEYFAMQPDGRRGCFADLRPGDKGNQYYPLCVSNTEVHDIIVGDWARELGERGVAPTEAPPYVNCCENDSPGFCVCASCRAWDAADPRFATHPYWNGTIREVARTNRSVMATEQWDEDGAAAAGLDPPSVTDRYVRFYNAVLEKARKVHPLAEVCAYAYANYRLPPREARVADGVVISFVPGIVFPYSLGEERRVPRRLARLERRRRIANAPPPELHVRGRKHALLPGAADGGGHQLRLRARHGRR